MPAFFTRAPPAPFARGTRAPTGQLHLSLRGVNKKALPGYPAGPLSIQHSASEKAATIAPIRRRPAVALDGGTQLDAVGLQRHPLPLGLARHVEGDRLGRSEERRVG